MSTQIRAAGYSIAGFRELEEPFVPLLKRCKTARQLSRIHAKIITSFLSQSTFLATRMIDVCCKFGAADYAAKIFDRIEEPTVFVFNSMIRACAYNDRHIWAIAVFRQMLSNHSCRRPDEFTYPFVIMSSGGIQSHSLGKQLHGCVCKAGLSANLVVCNSMLDMYIKCGKLSDARNLFDEMGDRNAVSWNCLITGHAKSGEMKKARVVFDETPDRTIVSWTAMISGYSQIGCYADALDVFREMQMEGVAPDEISIVSALPACSQLGALEVGEWIHFYSRKNGLIRNIYVCNALIEMYCKCGCIAQARQVFDEMPQRDVISWSTMIAGLANHGKGQEAIDMFEEMQRVGIKPNAITLVGVLSACAHSGLLNLGLQYFDSMKNDHNIEPGLQHYSCLVDVLGRSGKLSRALDLIEKMPMKPDAKIWGSLLSSCRTHRNIQVAEIAFEKLQEFEPDDTGNYVLLANIYADQGIWEVVSWIRKFVKRKSMKKMPGFSSIDVDGMVLKFVSGGSSKSFSNELFCWVLLLVQVQMSADEIVDTMPY